MKEYAVVYNCENYEYEITDYVLEIDLDAFLKNIENHPHQSLIEYYEI